MVDVPANIDTAWPMSGILQQGVAWHANSIETGGAWFDLQRYPTDTPAFFQPFDLALQVNPWGSAGTTPTVTTRRIVPSGRASHSRGSPGLPGTGG